MSTVQQAEWQPEYVVADGVLLAYFVSGRGRVPVVWLHGLPLDSRSWSAQRAHFDPLARNIFVDLRGYGASTRLPAACADVTQLYTNDLDRLLTYLDFVFATRPRLVNELLAQFVFATPQAR